MSVGVALLRSYCLATTRAFLLQAPRRPESHPLQARVWAPDTTRLLPIPKAGTARTRGRRRRRPRTNRSRTRRRRNSRRGIVSGSRAKFILTVMVASTLSPLSLLSVRDRHGRKECPRCSLSSQWRVTPIRFTHPPIPLRL